MRSNDTTGRHHSFTVARIVANCRIIIIIVIIFLLLFEFVNIISLLLDYKYVFVLF